MKKIITRFAPSPTGYLHIGGARTALFNYLFAKANNGEFLLRIEDTDRLRSTKEAVDAILNGLKWLDLNWDGEEVYQFSRIARHKEVALQLLEKGQAYKCFLSSEELDILRVESMRTGEPIVSKWRDAPKSQHPDLPYVIRIKAPLEGSTVIDDKVQGKVTTENKILDDMVLLRSDGTPTYMLAVVVDDHDMGVTHVIRGDDHLGNAARQATIYNAMNWEIPIFAHIPLIHGPDGKKLSKRHGALGVESYREMGYLPEALGNYLLRLGWSHGNDEIISREQAIEWFNLESIGKSPARLDFKKLDNVNSHYLKQTDNEHIYSLMNLTLSKQSRENILKGLDSLKQRANTLIDLSKAIRIYILEEEILVSEELLKLIDVHIVKEYEVLMNELIDWDKNSLMEIAKTLALEHNLKLGDIAAMLRITLTGSTTSPSVFEIMEILGKENTKNRFVNVQL
ncbi:MAG: glutamate--tRNA ligase [Pseudomonadota bacterium]